MQVWPPCSWRAPYLNIRNVTRDVSRDVMSDVSRNVSTNVTTDVTTDANTHVSRDVTTNVVESFYVYMTLAVLMEWTILCLQIGS